MNITIRHGDTYYRASVSLAWARRHDNGALVSCGLTVGENLSLQAFRRLRPAQLTVITKEQYNHSGCQSRCKLRGDTICQW